MGEVTLLPTGTVPRSPEPAAPRGRMPLVFLPGLLCDATLWGHQTECLADVAAPEVADLTRADSVAALAAGVLAHAPSQFALAGLSMGGYVAFEILRQAPERVAKLAVIDSSARPDSSDQMRRRQGLIALAGTGRFRGVTPRLLPLLIHPDRQADETLTGPIMAMAERIGAEAFRRQQTAILGRPDSRPGLAAITCPTLVIVGRQDALTPPDIAGEIADGIPRSRLAVIEDCGHLAPLERPQAVTVLLRDWLIYW